MTHGNTCNKCQDEYLQQSSVIHTITQMSRGMHATTQLLSIQLTKCQKEYIQQAKCFSCNKTYLFLLPSWISTPYLSHELTKTFTLCHFNVFILKRASIYFSHQSQPTLFLLDPLRPPLLCSFFANPMTFGSCISTSASQSANFLSVVVLTTRVS